MQVCGFGTVFADAELFGPAFEGFGVDAVEQFPVEIDDKGEESAEEHGVLEGVRKACGAVAAVNGAAGGGCCSAERGEGDGK